MENQAAESAVPAQPFNRFSIPVRWGIILGVLACILTTVQHMFLIDSYGLYMTVWILSFVLSLVFYCVAGVQQRKAMGGYITFKEAFSAIFVVILISSVISSIYAFIYFKYIDPDVMDKLKETTLTFMENVGAPAESIDDAAIEFDERLEDSKKPGPMLLSYFKGLIIYSIFGFICAAIVKKKKPVFDA